MTTKKWFVTALLCILIGLVGVSVYGVEFGNQREDYSKRWDFKNDELQRLLIDANLNANIQFIVSPESEGYIEAEGKWDKESIESLENATLSGGTFNLVKPDRVRIEFFNFNWSNSKPTLTVAIPDGHTLDEVKLTSSSTDYNLAGLHANTLDITNTSGELRLKDITVPRIELSLTSGDISGSGIEGDMNVKMTSGSFKMDAVTGNVTSDLTSGDFQIKELAGAANVTFTSGTVRIEQTTVAPIDVSGQSGDITIKAAPEFAGFYDVKVTSGDINIPESPMTSTDVIKARATSGSIKITQ
ncbi:DUF4097 family beta strand repeat-containing protein [Paenibacillus xylanexedens]|uniref:DUF4097 family beta strand repeat-containing protein n=1 Tax=Paenibacillus xylanexedens TaxID=528191 RepID=UPI00119D481E|nr:DUF4097 family beta strand repeat-containing protein [Paenibacillus xylanexedens]